MRRLPECLAADLPGDVIYAALSDEYRDIIPGYVATYEEAATPDASPPAN